MLLRNLIRTASVVAFCLICLIFSSRHAEAALVDDAKKEGALVFYGSMTTEHHGKLVAAFSQKYPFIKVEGFRANSLTIVNRVLTEQRSGRPLVDVMNVDELSGWVLKDRGLLQSYSSNETRAFPEAFRDPEGFFTCCTYVVTNVIAYNQKLVRKEEAPKTFDDLLLPKWTDKLGMETDLAKLFAALVPLWGKQKTIDYFTALRKQKPSMRSGRTLLAQLMAAGEFSVGLGFMVIAYSSCRMPACRWRSSKPTRWWHGPFACCWQKMRVILTRRNFSSTTFCRRKASDLSRAWVEPW